MNGDGTGHGTAYAAPHLGSVVRIEHPTANLITPDPNTGLTTQPRVEVFTSNLRGQTTTHIDANGNLSVFVRYPYDDPEGDSAVSGVPLDLANKQYGWMKEVHVDADPAFVSLVGSDGDLAYFYPADTGIVRYNTPGVYLNLVTSYEGGTGASGSGCSSCAYDLMGNPLAVTDPRGFTTRFDRNELGEIYRTIGPQPYNFRVETYFDANRNVTRVDTEDWQPAFAASDLTSPQYAQIVPTGSGFTANVPMQAGPGSGIGGVRPGWFVDLYTFDLLDDLIEQDLDATGSNPPNLVTKFQFDGNQNQIKTTKPAKNIVEYDYDERDLRIATRVGRDLALSPPPPGAVTVTAWDGNGDLLEVVGPANRGSSPARVKINDAFRGGVGETTYVGDRRAECDVAYLLCCAAAGETGLGFVACTIALDLCLKRCPDYEVTGKAYCTANITKSLCKTPDFGVGTSHCIACPAGQPQDITGCCPQGTKIVLRVIDAPGGNGPGDQPVCKVELTYSSAKCDDCPRTLNIFPEFDAGPNYPPAKPW